MTVISLYHKQFVESIWARYLSRHETKMSVYGILAEFFSGQYYDRPKEISMTLFKQQPKLLHRNVRGQPLLIGVDK